MRIDLNKEQDLFTQTVPGTGPVEHIREPKKRFRPFGWITMWREQRAARQRLEALANKSIQQGNKAKMQGKAPVIR